MDDQNSILELAKQSRFFDQQLLADDVLAMAEHGPKSITIQPATITGFAHVSVIDFETSSTEYTSRPMRRDAIALWLDGMPQQFTDTNPKLLRVFLCNGSRQSRRQKSGMSLLPQSSA